MRIRGCIWRVSKPSEFFSPQNRSRTGWIISIKSSFYCFRRNIADVRTNGRSVWFLKKFREYGQRKKIAKKYVETNIIYKYILHSEILVKQLSTTLEIVHWWLGFKGCWPWEALCLLVVFRGYWDPVRFAVLSVILIGVAFNNWSLTGHCRKPVISMAKLIWISLCKLSLSFTLLERSNRQALKWSIK